MKIALLQPKLAQKDPGGNLHTIHALVDRNLTKLRKVDICVLPECWFRSLSRREYESEARKIQKKLKTVLVAGSHHEADGVSVYNRGVVLGKDGRVLARYGKRHPFDREAHHGVKAHGEICEFKLGGARVAVMICADFFFSEIFHKFRHQPDIVFIPAESVSSSSNDPRYGRNIWHHTAVARAYEFTTFIAISDWATSSEARTCGATGFADPTTQDNEPFFQWAGEGEGVLIAQANLERLKTHRKRRQSMNFFWR